MRNPLRVLAPGATAAVVTLLALLPIPAAGQTDGFILHCLSARAAGMGCVTRGQEGVPTDLFRDPAGIVSFARPTFEANVTAFMPSISFQNSANSDASGALHGYPMGSVAYVGPKLTAKLAWAVGMEPIGGLGSDFRLTNQVLGPAQSYESFFAGVKAGPVVAYELAPGFSIGASASLVYAQVRDFRMPFSMPASAAAGMAGLAQLDPHFPAMFATMTELTAYGDSKGFASTSFTGDVGVSWKASPRLRLSASWSPKSTMPLSGGTASIDMTTQFTAMFSAMMQDRMLNHGQTQQQAQATLMQMFAQAGVDLGKGTVGHYDAAMDMTLPQTIAVGASYRPAPRWTVALEGGWMQWSKAMNQLPFKLTNGDNTNLNILINANPSNAAFTYIFPLSWKDSYIAKVGVERALGRNALRLGYIFGSNPVPDSTIFITLPAIVEQSATVGATVQLGHFPLDVAVVHAFKKQLTGASTDLIGSEYAGSLTGLQETVVTVGTVLKF